MSAYKTYAMLADGGGGGAGVNDDPDKILQSAHEQEDQFDQLTRDLEVERKAVSNQLEKYRLGSDTATLSSISSTNNSFHWRPAPPDAILEEESDLGSRVTSPQLIDNVQQGLSDKNGDKMSSVGYGHPNSYQRAVYPNNNQSWQQEAGSRSSLDRGIPPSAAADRRPAADDYLTAVPASERQRESRYADSYLDTSVPLPTYGTVHHDNSSLDRYVPHSSQQQPQQSPQYRPNTGYAPSESDRGSELGGVRQPVAPPRTSTANRQPAQAGSRYRDPDSGSVQGSVQSLPYGQPRSNADDGYITRSVMNAVSAPPPSSHQDQHQPHFVNNGYQPDTSDYAPDDRTYRPDDRTYRPDDRTYRPTDSYPGSPYQPTTPNSRQQYPNSAYDPEPEYLNRSHASLDRAQPQQQPMYAQGARSPSEASDYPPGNWNSAPAPGNRPNGVGDYPHDAAVLQASANKPFETVGMPVTTMPADGEGQGSWRNPDLQEVIDFLSHPSNAVKVNAAAHLQHLSYMNDNMKAKIGVAGGIPPLVALLSHPMLEVQRAACGALRNLSFGRANDDNKRAIRDSNGLRELVRLLRQTPDDEIRELVTGILWNMSSCQEMKKSVIDNALTALVEVVIIPQAGRDPRFAQSPSDGVYWTTVFRNTSGTLRNISSDGSYSRKRLRECPNLVDAVVNVLKTAIGKNDIDNKSVENLVCLLRNLSFACQEIVDPDYVNKRNAQNQDASKNCFGGSKSPKKESSSKSPKNSGKNKAADKPKPTQLGPKEYRGMQMLWHPLIVKVYQPILTDSTNPETLEAAAGALQNLSACDWEPAVELRSAVRQEKCLPVLVELLSLDADAVVHSAAAALRNLAIDERNKELIGKYAIRQLTVKLPERNVPPATPVSDNTIAAVVATVYEVVKHNVDFAQSFKDEGGVDRLLYIDENRTRYSPRVVKYTQLLLSTLWKEFPALHDQFKNSGYTEQQFNPKSSGSSKQKTGSTPSTPNTISRPSMNQGATSYNQQTPKPISRHHQHMPPEAYDSFVRQDNQQLNSTNPDRHWSDIPLNDEQVPMSYMGASKNNNNNNNNNNADDVFYSPTAQPYNASNTYRDEPDSRYGAARPENVSLTYPTDGGRYAPTHVADGGRYTPIHLADSGRYTPTQAAGGGRYTPTQAAGGGRYTPTPVTDSRYSVVPPNSNAYQSSPYQPHTNAYHPDDVAVGYQPASSSYSDLRALPDHQTSAKEFSSPQEPIYSHINRQTSITSSQQRLDLQSQSHAAAPQVDSWV